MELSSPMRFCVWLKHSERGERPSNNTRSRRLVTAPNPEGVTEVGELIVRNRRIALKLMEGQL
jgi:hypothetical protein